MWPVLLCHRLNGSDICAMKYDVTCMWPLLLYHRLKGSDICAMK